MQSLRINYVPNKNLQRNIGGTAIVLGQTASQPGQLKYCTVDTYRGVRVSYRIPAHFSQFTIQTLQGPRAASVATDLINFHNLE